MGKISCRPPQTIRSHNPRTFSILENYIDMKFKNKCLEKFEPEMKNVELKPLYESTIVVKIKIVV